VIEDWDRQIGDIVQFSGLVGNTCGNSYGIVLIPWDLRVLRDSDCSIVSGIGYAHISFVCRYGDMAANLYLSAKTLAKHKGLTNA